jgi:alanine racemase
MDLITLDVTRCGAAARPGALVELLGPQALLDDQAEAAGTANYELLVRLGSRIARSYRGAGA